MRKWIKRTLAPTDIRDRRILFGPAAGLTMRIDPSTDLRFWLGVHEIELAPFFRRLVYPGARSFDIGAAEGYQALIIARLSEQPVVVFEPGEVWRDILVSNMKLNGYKVTLEQVFVSASTAGSSSTIDIMAEKHFTPDFIKMDIEGAETDALAGATKVLSDRKPHMIVEVHGTKVEQVCLKILRSHGYHPRVVNPRWWLREHRPLKNNRWLICEGHE
ncbi:MAG: FkbM family methyltransferase [Pseudomonadota bacterium]|nr:FkbM family methyltransferase [Pseudomonadota bacterium]